MFVVSELVRLGYLSCVFYRDREWFRLIPYFVANVGAQSERTISLTLVAKADINS